jgi:hypothetical protein
VRGISRKAKIVEGNRPTPHIKSYPHHPREFFGRIMNIYNVDLTMNYLSVRECENIRH